MLKKITLIAFILSTLIVLGIAGYSLHSFFYLPRGNNENNTLCWLPEESHFLDYYIDQDTVVFRYSICFINNSDCDMNIKISAKFLGNELEGWVQDAGFFEGYSENGEWEYRNIKSGEKRILIYSFKGEYLGGPVNTKLSFPCEILIAQTLDSCMSS